MEENKEELEDETLKEKAKTKKNNKALIIILVLVIIALLSGGGFFALQYLKLNEANKNKGQEQEQQEQQEQQEEHEKDEEKDKTKIEQQDEAVQVKLVSEDKLKKGVHQLVKKGNTAVTGPENVVYIDEGVYEIELTVGNYADINLFDVMGDVKLSAALYGNDITQMRKITETYIYTGMYLQVNDEHIPDNLKGGANIEVSLRRIDKPLDKISVKTDKSYLLKEKEEGEFYLVGKDIEAGTYDVNLITGDGGRLYVEYRDQKTKLSVALYRDENLFKDVELNNGDKVAFLPMSAPEGTSVSPTYHLTGK